MHKGNCNLTMADSELQSVTYSLRVHTKQYPAVSLRSFNFGGGSQHCCLQLQLWRGQSLPAHMIYATAIEAKNIYFPSALSSLLFVVMENEYMAKCSDTKYNGGPWEWWTLGVADPGSGGPFESPTQNQPPA